ncbi:hypothetical protein GYMLUDRAFT_775353 [Collybiopsis luxurians FD-317 M1]|uniref:Uncharacterized protein n=1 Tax=Collybiopsis luxurians FD-317 M1 TaxID=944289 RepID=A0A0D0CNL8_9AGAR|nr:hypothetical protein GYMLUDRAFT_775353 [Collybiopsis luxurians FD-317 M1]
MPAPIAIVLLISRSRDTGKSTKKISSIINRILGIRRVALNLSDPENPSSGHHSAKRTRGAHEENKFPLTVNPIRSATAVSLVQDHSISW